MIQLASQPALSQPPSLIGKCRICGCTDVTPCRFVVRRAGEIDRCFWMDFDHTLCSNLRCVAMVPMEEIEEIIATWCQADAE